jgi:hypothetical protein
MLIALAAAVAMFFQDLLAVLMVQAEARNKAVLAGVMDCLQWPAGMLTTAITVTAFQGHDGAKTGLVIAAVTVANFCGTWTAVHFGRRHIKEKRPACACGCPVAAKGAS